MLELPPDTRARLDEGRSSLAGIKIPVDANDESRRAIRRAIDESFVAGFRLVAFIAAGLALMSAFAACWLIEGKTHEGRLFGGQVSREEPKPVTGP